MRPECRIVVGVPTKDFHRAWPTAAGGRITHAWVAMNKSHDNDASVPSVSFSNEPVTGRHATSRLESAKCAKLARIHEV